MGLFRIGLGALLLAGLAVFVLARQAGAQDHAGASQERKERSELSTQRKPLEQHWAQLDEAQRRKLLRRLHQLKQMPEEKRRLLQERLKRFQTLAPEQQRAVLKHLRKFKDLSPEERNRLRTRFQRLKCMKQQQRRRLRQLFKALIPLTEEEKTCFRLLKPEQKKRFLQARLQQAYLQEQTGELREEFETLSLKERWRRILRWAYDKVPHEPRRSRQERSWHRNQDEEPPPSPD